MIRRINKKYLNQDIIALYDGIEIEKNKNISISNDRSIISTIDDKYIPKLTELEEKVAELSVKVSRPRIRTIKIKL